ncbi:hypothetical protein THMIRHAS_04600 [Thiosulfatimonas sediminis]|uniref:Uncharacterized protein n=1 Tax=Thiosulfatimonas sediminis TaxID=2675054 RepID=A0A6F8PSS8_9GAMM|nr:hypothetical protein [Thiosulfatimonas sediminis]BBP45087.1 hypothetical protein THMIRHAS_04600 [Thiosulfatimonas sediminis]
MLPLFTRFKQRFSLQAMYYAFLIKVKYLILRYSSLRKVLITAVSLVPGLKKHLVRYWIQTDIVGTQNQEPMYLQQLRKEQLLTLRAQKWLHSVEQKREWGSSE